MRRLLYYCTFAIALWNPFTVVASEEGVLRLNTFQVTSPDEGQFGSVVVSGELDTKQFVSLKVKAFGRTVSLSKDQLAKLRGGSINGVQISAEVGYSKVGGRTIYVVLSTGFTTGLHETQLLSVNEQGTVKVNDVVRK